MSNILNYIYMLLVHSVNDYIYIYIKVTDYEQYMEIINTIFR